jgi:hypothetical protein
MAIFGQILANPDLLSAPGLMLLGPAWPTYCAATIDLLRQLTRLDRLFAPKYSFNSSQASILRFDWPVPSLSDLLRNPIKVLICIFTFFHLCYIYTDN